VKETRIEQLIANLPWRLGAELFLAWNRKWNGADIFDKMLSEYEKTSLK